ncbi:MAG TPA: hypothetical protein VKX24_05850 [Acidimicrobiia bacterium]|nr:hypothetical protein [Acidimicrobiia bacterium]
MRGRLAGAALTAALLGVVALLPARPVSALDRPGDAIRVGENQTVEKNFGPMTAADPLPDLPSPAPQLNTPAACRQAAYCDVIPLEIVLPPGLRPADEFFVSVQHDWKTSTLPGTDYTRPTEVNDMDLYVWTDPAGDEPVQQSSTGTMPEKLRLFRPTKGKYSIVVFNYRGPNTGYRLTVADKPEQIVPPFESLAPDFNPPALAVEAPAVEEPAEQPEAPPARPAAPPVPVVSDAPAPVPPKADVAPPALTPVPVEPDPDFSNFSDEAFDRQLAAPSADVLQAKRAKAVGPPPPASAGSLVLWLAGVPLLLVAAGGLWLWRKGSAVLDVG